MFVAFVPKFARYPYEVYVTCREHRPSVGAMSDTELDDLAYVLLEMTRRYDALFGFSMPYIMAMHQAPTNGQHDYNWFHVEFYPPYRTANKLKYLAGSEAGMGAFINDTLPEVTSAQLREIPITPIR
jgi:UDPglucose--hexose-1-phosphate uridylyltransferase